MKSERVSTCLRRMIPGREAVDVLYAPAHRSAHYSGLQTCGSVWLCPVCAAKISERRRIELQAGAASWRDKGGRHALVTFTLQHHAGENLSTVLAALTKARRFLLSGRAAQGFRETYGIIGQVRALEITHGENGWHPHLHVLLFLESSANIAEMTKALQSRWVECVKAVGHYASEQYGCDVRETDEDITDYLAKFGKEPKWDSSHELTKSNSKIGKAGGKTPLELLSDYVFNHDERAGRLWLQYACNFKGQRQLFWSHGLRDKLGLNKEKTDEELAAEQTEEAVILASLGVGAWRIVVANDARADLLNVAARGDKDAVYRFLARLGVPNVLLPDDAGDAGDVSDEAPAGDELGAIDQAPAAPAVDEPPAIDQAPAVLLRRGRLTGLGKGRPAPAGEGAPPDRCKTAERTHPGRNSERSERSSGGGVGGWAQPHPGEPMSWGVPGAQPSHEPAAAGRPPNRPPGDTDRR